MQNWLPKKRNKDTTIKKIKEAQKKINMLRQNNTKIKPKQLKTSPLRVQPRSQIKMTTINTTKFNNRTQKTTYINQPQSQYKHWMRSWLKHMTGFWSQSEKVHELTSDLPRIHLLTKQTLLIHFFHNCWSIVKGQTTKCQIIA